MEQLIEVLSKVGGDAFELASKTTYINGVIGLIVGSSVLAVIVVAMIFQLRANAKGKAKNSPRVDDPDMNGTVEVEMVGLTLCALATVILVAMLAVPRVVNPDGETIYMIIRSLSGR